MLTCKEASYLASKKLDEKLTLKERMGFWLHIGICSLCRHYSRDINNLHELMKKTIKSDLVLLPETVKLSEQSRERIKQTLDKTLHQTERS